uniref:Calmodulin like 4 n=1 Tax=Crocodylus porosus TaxID=8502 RepID=A0A7M4FQD2_CROPO
MVSGKPGGLSGKGSSPPRQPISPPSSFLFVVLQAKFLSQDQINDRRAELDFSTFLNIMYKQMQQEDPQQEIRTAMAMIDRQKKGFIPVSELRAKLTKMGEKLSEEEVDDLLKEAKVGPNGIIKYEDFIRRITVPITNY